MPYVVRDRRALRQWVGGLLVSVVVVVGVCAVTDRWWVAAVGLPLSLAWAGQRLRSGTTPLRADGTGIALDGRWTDWKDVDEVAVLGQRVRVTLRETAPLPAWARGRVTGAGDDRLQLTTRVSADPREVHAGIRAERPESVRTILSQ